MRLGRENRRVRSIRESADFPKMIICPFVPAGQTGRGREAKRLSALNRSANRVIARDGISLAPTRISPLET